MCLPPVSHIQHKRAGNRCAAIPGRKPVLSEFLGFPAALYIFVFKYFNGWRDGLKVVFVTALSGFGHPVLLITHTPPVEVTSDKNRPFVVARRKELQSEHRISYKRVNQVILYSRNRSSRWESSSNSASVMVPPGCGRFISDNIFRPDSEMITVTMRRSPSC